MRDKFELVLCMLVKEKNKMVPDTVFDELTCRCFLKNLKYFDYS